MIETAPAIATAASTPVPAPRASPSAGLRIALVTETFPPEVNGVAMTLARMLDGLPRGAALLADPPGVHRMRRNARAAAERIDWDSVIDRFAVALVQYARMQGHA